LGGAALSKGGISALNLIAFLKIGASIFISPLVGFSLAFILMTIVSIVLFRWTPKKVDRLGRVLQLFSAALYSLGHGGNDAQKTMGIIAVLLFSSGLIGTEFHIPIWIVLACQGAIGLGTLLGGWRIVRTMGMRITKLKPIGGTCAETAGAITLFTATMLGIPVSTTHTITGSIMGVGAVVQFSAVRWGVAQRIVWAWILTIPASAFMSSLTWWLVCLFMN
jgi:PiT family inorganic phosphate transporter